jgi:hypothetical protein
MPQIFLFGIPHKFPLFLWLPYTLSLSLPLSTPSSHYPYRVSRRVENKSEMAVTSSSKLQETQIESLCLSRSLKVKSWEIMYREPRLRNIFWKPTDKKNSESLAGNLKVAPLFIQWLLTEYRENDSKGVHLALHKLSANLTGCKLFT